MSTFTYHAPAFRSIQPRHFCGLLADFLNLTIVTRLVGLYGENAPAPSAAHRSNALPAWRLKRAVEFIDAHIDSPMTLAELAEAVGLSRMHFAAQLRRATGFRPNEYMLRHRVEKARTMLAETNVPIAELALNVGFSSQSHFTSAFKRFSGLAPSRWRRRCAINNLF
jgi:AraC family transcriptional regulator